MSDSTSPDLGRPRHPNNSDCSPKCSTHHVPISVTCHLARISRRGTPGPLVVPSAAPARVEHKLLVAYVAFKSEPGRNGVADTELSGRHLAELLRRSSDSATARVLRTLREPPEDWLFLSGASVGMRAHRYGLGARAIPESEAWKELGDQLFGTDGLLAGSLGEPLGKFGYLNQSGLIVLASLEHHGPGDRRTITARLGGLISRDTVRNAVDRLGESGLVKVDSDVVSLVAGHERRLLHLGAESGVACWADEQERRHREERDSLYDAIAAERTGAQDAHLRCLPCIYCGKPAVLGDAEVEHFPPLHWTPADRYTIRLPTCRAHNQWLGQQVRGTYPGPSNPPEQVTFVSDSDDLPFFLVRLLLNDHARYTQLLIEGRRHEAAEVARAACERLAPQRNRMARVRHPDTGETDPLARIDIFETVLHLLDDHSDRLAAIRHITPDSAFWTAGESRAPST